MEKSVNSTVYIRVFLLWDVLDDLKISASKILIPSWKCYPHTLHYGLGDDETCLVMSNCSGFIARARKIE